MELTNLPEDSRLVVTAPVFESRLCDLRTLVIVVKYSFTLEDLSL